MCFSEITLKIKEQFHTSHHKLLIFDAWSQIQDSYRFLDDCLLKSHLSKIILTPSKELLELIQSTALPLEASGTDYEVFG
jgi:hypothetical protein